MTLADKQGHPLPIELPHADKVEDCAGYILRIQRGKSEGDEGGERGTEGGPHGTPQRSRLVLQRLHKHQHLIILVLLDTMYV